MSAIDKKLVSSPAPPPENVQPPEVAVRKDNDRMGPTVVIVILVLAFLIGAVALVMTGHIGSDEGSVSTETATGAENAAKDAAPAAPTVNVPAECLKEITDTNTRWYCKDFWPFATQASADHRRIERLETVVKEARNSDVPAALWSLIIFLVLITGYNSVLIHTKKPPTG